MGVMASLVLLALLAAAPAAAQQAEDRDEQEASGDGGLPAESWAIRVQSPRPGEVLRDAFADVQWELIDPGAAPGVPLYEIQLDGEEPIRTSLNEHTFTGLAPGTHVVRVRLVDANHIPVPETEVEVPVQVPAPESAPAQPQPEAPRPQQPEQPPPS